MKKNVKLVLGLFIASLAFYGGYQGYSSYTGENESDLLLSNIEALANRDDEGGGFEVTCYCKSNESRPTICVAGGGGSYCGSDPCSNHDGNCR